MMTPLTYSMTDMSITRRKERRRTSTPVWWLIIGCIIFVMCIILAVLGLNRGDPDSCSDSQLQNPYNPIGYKCISRECHEDYKKCTKSECKISKYGNSLTFNEQGKCVFTDSVDSNKSPM